MRPVLALQYARRHRDRFISELKEFIRFPSVSSQPKHAQDVRDCARWLVNHLRKIGLARVEAVPTRQHPVVYAEWTRRPGAPTVLIYGHYDVVPADPVREWKNPPFAPLVRGNNLHGRGASDDKGQLFCHVKALESYLRTGDAIPVNVKCVFEGEDEILSPNFRRFVMQNRAALASDVAVISDTKMLGPDRPAISYTQRGSLTLELEVLGPHRDLHSGNFGGAVHNPLQALCEMIGRLHDEQMRIAIPGVYDDVRSWSGEERDYMLRTGPSDAELRKSAEVSRTWGEKGYSLYERTTVRPALTINGITGGYQGPGSKGIIPGRAVAKLSFRLVPGQDPGAVEKLFRQHVSYITPPTVSSRVRTVGKAKPALINRDHPFMRAAAVACRSGFGAAPVFVHSGGTVTTVNVFREVLKIPTILMGFGLPDDRVHAPDEKFSLQNFDAGIRTSITFLAAAAKVANRPRARHEPDLALRL
jgi:acetylornithine deacetylase/succinyl-diaminopimelate desuccinylase-like protein